MVTPRRRARAEPSAREAPDLFGGDVRLEEAPSVSAVDRARSSAPPGAIPATAISVATLTAATKDVLEGSFPPLWVRGEVVGFKRHRNGHWYFTLKDEVTQVRCVVWAGDARRMIAEPDEGMEVLVRGQLTLYAAKSDLQFRVTALAALGDGLWRKAFDRTRARLEADGLLTPERKRPLPKFPRCLAVVTSTDGAALHDIIAVVRRRFPVVEIVVVPAIVQGDGAPASLCAALSRIARWRRADVVIIGRGGGGRSDLWAFNDESVARALAACPVPTIAAIGHEVDVTICDLVADWRAPTPSAAGEAAVPVLGELAGHLRLLGRALGDAADARLRDFQDRLSSAGEATIRAADRPLLRRRVQLQTLADRLQVLSPLGTLSRGYAAVSDGKDRVISSVRHVSVGDPFTVRLRDGRVSAHAERIEPSPPAGTDGAG